MKGPKWSGERLAEIREKRRFTQHDLASALRTRGFGTTQTTISRWESEQKPQSAVLPHLAEVLRCQISDFYADDSQEAAPLGDSFRGRGRGAANGGTGSGKGGVRASRRRSVRKAA